MTIIAATPEAIGLRADQFLAKSVPDCSRSEVTRLIKSGSITEKRRGVFKPNLVLSGDEEFLVGVKVSATPQFMAAQAIDLDIIFSDEHLAVINKPKGLVVHPGAGVKDGTLCHALLHHFPGLEISDDGRPGIVHRLDKDTSGVMVVAKTTSALRKLSQAFLERQVGKRYLALCHGEFAESEFTITSGHVRHPQHRLKFLTNLEPPKSKNSEVRLARTHFKVLSSAYGVSALLATLDTGRTHQIRAHLADRNHPLVGDSLYCAHKNFRASMPEHLKTLLSDFSGQALHAYSLSFVHPVTEVAMSFFAPCSKFGEALRAISTLE